MAVLARVPRRALVLLGALAALAVGITVWQLETNASASSEALLPTAKVTRNDIVVSVGGVGRVVQANVPAQLVVPSSSSSSTGGATGASTSPGGSSVVPGDAVFAHTSGHVSKLLVDVGERVRPGQPLARVDDGGVSNAAVQQAENDLEAARVELQQKQAQDPLRGFPPTPAEIEAGNMAVAAAEEKLALLGKPRPADVAAARFDVRKAEGDLETLQGTPAARAQAIALARENVRAAKKALARLYLPPFLSDVSAAQADVANAVAARQTAVAGKVKAVSDRARAVADREAAVAGNAKAVSDRARAVADKEAAVAALAKSEADREAAVAAKARAVADQSKAVADLTKAVADQTTAVAAKVRAVADEKKAVADKATLLKPPTPPTQAALDAAHQAVSVAQQKIERLTGTPDSTVVAAALADVRRAQADLSDLQASKASSAAIDAAQAAADAAQRKYDKVVGPADPLDLANAQLDLNRALADQAALEQPPVQPLPESVAAADSTITAADSAIKSANKGVAAANKAVTAATSNVSAANEGVRSASQNIVSANQAIASAKENIVAANQNIVSANQGIASGKENIVAANQNIVSATQAIVAAKQTILASGRTIYAAKRKAAHLHAKPLPSDVEAARANLAKARSDLETLVRGPGPQALAAARKAVVAAKVKLAQLLGPPLPSDVAAARADVAKAKGDLAALLARSSPASTFDLRLGQLKVKAAEQKLAVARFASRQLTVRAESPGTVTSVLTEPGAPVDGTTPIATVTDLGKLDVRVDLSEFDVARVKRGQPAKVSIDALGGASYPGVVRFAALTGTDNGGVVTFPVIVGLKPVKDVKPGMNVSVRIIVAKRHNVPQVPLEAVTHNDEDRPVVTVINNSGQTSTKPVTLGLANNKSVQIVKGVQPGQRLVLPASGGDEG